MSTVFFIFYRLNSKTASSVSNSRPEKILADISFEAPDRQGQHIVVDRDYVSAHLEDVKNDVDLSRYVL